MSDHILDQIEALAESALVAAAEAALAAAEAAVETAKQRAEAADLDAIAASDAFPALIVRAADGEEISAATVLRVNDATRDTRILADYFAAVARRMAANVETAREALADAKHEALQPALRAAQDLHIEAGRKFDAARLLAAWGSSTPPSEAARREAAAAAAAEVAKGDFLDAMRLLDLAAGRGLKIAFRHGPPEWPMTEQQARAFWDRPISIEETADAA